jgi:hypothetical protein
MIFIDDKIPDQPKEKYYGNREYKLHLTFDKITMKHIKLYEFNNDNDDKGDIIDISDNGDNDIINKYNYLENSTKNFDISNLMRLNNLEKLNKRATQLLFRLNEGKGKSIYLIGVDDNGTANGIPLNYIIESYHYMLQMCNIINANLNIFRVYKGNKKYIATCRISIDYYDEYYNEFDCF